MTTVKGAPSLKMRCVEKGPRKRRKLEPDALPDGVAERLGELLPADVLEEALEGLSPEQITAPGGLLTQLAGRVIETALGAELTGHLGHPPGAVPAGANVRNGSTSKTLQTDLGPVGIDAARSRRQL